jgi:hypothetical protein
MVGGCYADATADPTSSGPGTCIALSLQNFPESFRPTDLLYLPEPIIAFLGRPTDTYLFVGCRDSIHQVQYVGGSDGPACILTTLWPDVGIANPHGFCQAYGILFAAVSRGGLVTIGPMGQPDNTFAAPIAEAIKDWDPRYTVMQWHPDTNQIVASNGSEAYAFSLAHGGWSAKLPYSDFVSGSALSATQSANQMRITIESDGARTLYDWNAGSPSTITALSHWTKPAPGRTKTVWEVADSLQMDSLTNTAYVSIHRNFRKPSNETGAITAATNTLTTTQDFFTAADVGSFVLVLGAGAAGAPLLARIKTVVDARTVNLCDTTTAPIAGAPNLSASTTVSNAFFLIAKKIYSRTPRYADSNVFRPKRVRVRDAYSYALGITIPSTSQNVQALGAALYGTVDGLSAGTTS